MELTKENKTKIDEMDHYSLLKHWRFGTSENMFQGETGEYWAKRMAELKAENPDQAVQDSKDMGLK